MGDSGAFYVPSAEAPIYRSLLPTCHLLLPNQFELETLTSRKITNLASLLQAVGVLHKEHRVPHVFVTSTQLKEADNQEAPALTLIGSTARSSGEARPFLIEAPYFPVYFTGTGDAFAALMTARLRDEAEKSGVIGVNGWLSPDGVPELDLPLAKAAQLVVASMQAVLSKTWKNYRAVKDAEVVDDSGEEWERSRRLRLMKAIELRIVGNVHDLLNPPNKEEYQAKTIESHIAQ
jgi:pyridoxine kinase